MKKISVGASRNYDVIMERGLLQNAAAYINEAFGRDPAGMKLCRFSLLYQVTCKDLIKT